MPHDLDAEAQRERAESFYQAGNFVEASKAYQRAIEIDPKSGTYDRWLECLEKLDKKTKDKAIEDVEKLIGEEPGRVYAYHLWGLALHDRNKYPEAIAKYKKAIALDPHFAYAYHNWGRSLAAQKKYPEAIEQYRKAIELKPDFIAISYNNWGLALYEQKLYQEAIKQYRKAIEAKPDNARVYVNWGNALYDQQKYLEAVEKYQNAIKIDPNSISYNRWLECLEKLNKNTKDKAIEDVETFIEDKPEYVDAYNNWGLALANRKEYAASIEKYRQAIKLKSDYAFAYNNWGLALYGQKLYPEAIEQYRKAIEAKPDNARVYVNWGNALYDQQKYLEAVEKYQSAIKIDPNSISYDRWMGCLEKVDENSKQKALEAARTFVEGRPEYVDAYNNWGLALANRKQYAAAIEKYRQAIKLKSDYAFAYNNWGVALYEQKLYQEAIEQYRNAIEAKPDNARVYNNWGNALYDQEKHLEAAEKYQSAIKIDPNSVSYDSWLECLERLDKHTKDKAIEDVESFIEGKPDFVDAYNNWGLALANRKEYAAAIEKYRQAIKLKSDYAFAYNNWGRALATQKKYPEAIEQYRKAIELKADSVAISYYNWGVALHEQKLYPEAIEQYRKAIKTKSDNVLAYNNWGNALYAQQKYLEAAEKYQSALKIDPNAINFDGWLDCLENVDESSKQKALEAARKFIEGKPEYVDAYNSWGLALANRKEYAPAIEKYQAATMLRPTYAESYFNWGCTLGNQGRYEEAIEMLRKAINADAGFAYAYHNIAHYLWKQGRYRAGWEAWEATRRAYERARANEIRRRNAYHFYNYANVLSAMFGEFEEAQRNYKQGLAFDPNHVGILSSLVDLYLEMAEEEFDQGKEWRLLKDEVDADWRATACANAWSVYIRAEELLKDQTEDPTLRGAALQLGEIYLSMKQYPGAEIYLKKALQRDAASPAPYTDLGVLYMRKEAFKDAIQYFEDARERDPYDFTIRSNLAGAYVKMNLNEKAESEYKRILEVTQDHIESHIGLGEIYTVMGDSGDIDMYDLGINHFDRAIKLARSKTGSKRVKRKDLAAVYYSRGYSTVKLYEAGKLTKDEALLYQAIGDFRSCLENDSEHHKARRAKDKIEKKIGRFSPQRLAERWGPLSIFFLSLIVFLFTQSRFVFQPSTELSKQAGYYALLTFGSLIFMVAGLYLPQILKLKVGGIQLEKSTAEQITTPGSIGISK